MGKKAGAIPVSTLHKYLRATIGRAPAIGESLLDLVATTLALRHGLDFRPRQGVSHKATRKFLNAHRERLIQTANAAPPKCAVAEMSRAPQSPRVVSASIGRKPALDVASISFLSTFEWRRVRMSALKKYGTRCQCCGASPSDGAVMNVDHIKPRKLFPHLALDVDNLQVLCGDCNHGKGNWDMTDWRERESA